MLHISTTQASCKWRTGSWSHYGSGKTSVLEPTASSPYFSYFRSAASYLTKSPSAFSYMGDPDSNYKRYILGAWLFFTYFSKILPDTALTDEVGMAP